MGASASIPDQNDEERGEILPNENTPLVTSSSSDPPNADAEHSHDHEHGHEHSHHDDKEDVEKKEEERGHFYHDEPRDKTDTRDNPVLKRLKTATVLCLIFMTVEVIGGYIAGSLAVLSDAAHLMADLASFAVAIVAAYLAARPSTPYHTYGLKRTESLAALFSMTTLAAISIGLGLEAIRRIYVMVWGNSTENQDVDGKLMSGIATIGVLVNVALAAVLGEHHVHMPGMEHDHDHDHSHSHDHNHSHESNSMRLHSNELAPPQEKEPPQRNVNLQAAYLHVLADLAQSVAVLIAGLIIWWRPQWKIVDPIATIMFCILVFYSTLGVIRASVCVLLEEVPPHISWQTIHEAIEGVPSVRDVHDLHVWSISQGINAMSVHLRLVYQEGRSKEECAVEANHIMKTVARIARQHGMSHSTIQVQHSRSACEEDAGCITCVMGDESQACALPGASA